MEWDGVNESESIRDFNFCSTKILRTGDECLKHSYSTRVSLSFSCCFYINYIVLCLDSLFGVCFGYRYVGAKRAVFGAMKSKAWKRLSRRDVPTSRRQLEILTLSFKVRMAQTSRGIGRHTKGGTDFQSRVIQTSRKCPGFVPLFIFWIFSDIRMMFSLLNICIFSFVMF